MTGKPSSTRCGQELDGECINSFHQDGGVRVANVVLLV